MDLAAGTCLGSYEILSPLGKGGMGEVYLAQDTKLRRKVALKLLGEELATHPDRLRRFTQEAETAAALSHPNVAHIYEVNQQDGINFIAMEYVEGETLRRHIAHGRITLRDALDLSIQVASALAAAHQAGIVHRDIKPENIMLRPDGYVKVLDFGLAKLTQQQTVSIDTEAPTVAKANTDPGTIMGTVNYMSPEQARGKPVDARSDIFSLGVVIYEMVAGRAPFEAETPSDVMSFILHKEPLPLARYSPELPVELERIVSKALVKDKEERYQTAKDLLIDLKRLKQKQEFAAELERSVSPDPISGAPAASASSGPAVGGAMGSAGPSDKTAIKAASRAVYVVAEIKRHKLGFIAALAILLLLGGLGFWLLSKRSADTTQIESIAVLPFVNESGNADVEYLSDGMTETLIRSLSQLPNLNVKARSSVFRYKGKTADAKTIGKELGVQAVLNGRVIQRGDRLTLSLELINAENENVIWADQYDRKSSDLVSLQSEIAHDVSSKLRLKLSGADRQNLAKSYTNDPEAYRLYLQGRFYLNKRVGKSFDRAESYFKQAIEKDSNFALGYVGLAEFLKEQDRPKAKEYIMQALALDNQLSDAHATLGYQLMLDYDFAASEREFKRAIELDPNNARAYQWNATRLLMLGLYDESLAAYRRAVEIEPTLADIRNNVAGCLVASGKVEAGIEEIKKSMELDPTFAWTHSHLSFIYRMKGDHAASVEERARAAELLEQSENAKRLRETFATGGWTEYLRELLRQDWGSLGTSGTRRASLLAELGEKEEAISSLTLAAERGDYWLFSIKYDPAFDGLRGDPRFQALVKKFNPPQRA